MKQGKEQCTKNEGVGVLVLALQWTPLCQPDTCDFPEQISLSAKLAQRGRQTGTGSEFYLSSPESWDSGQVLQGSHGGKEGSEWTAPNHHPHPCQAEELHFLIHYIGDRDVISKVVGDDTSVFSVIPHFTPTTKGKLLVYMLRILSLSVGWLISQR